MSTLKAYFFPGTLFVDRVDIWMFLTLDVPHQNYYNCTILMYDGKIGLLDRTTSDTVHDKRWGRGWYNIDAIYAI